MNRIKPACKWLGINLSLKYKLLILLVTTSLLPIMIVSYSSQYFLFHSGTEYSGSISTQYVQFLSREMSGYLMELDKLLSPIYVKSEFQKFINTPKDAIEEQAQLTASLRPFIQNILETKNELHGVLYMDALGKSSYFSYKNHFDFLYSMEDDPFYKTVPEYKRAELSPLHLAQYTLGQPSSIFSYVIPVVNFNAGKEITAWIIVEIQQEKINNMLQQDDMGLHSHLFLFNPSTNVAISDKKLEPHLAESFNQIVTSADQHQASFVYEIEAKKYQMTYHSLSSSEWKLVWIAPLNNINQGVQQASRLTMLIAATSLIISLFIAFPVMNKVLKPLFKLISSMRKLGRGAIETILIKPSNDEFGFLILSYNRMVNDLRTLEKEVYQAQLKEKERELLQLQAQINPHFLFNTLEAIDSYATENNGKAVNAMVQSVSKMMRYSVRNDGGWAPIKDEISYIHHFLNVHYYRHDRKVAVNIQMDSSCEQIQIMKLSIQPFLENAIKYGWSPAMRNNEFSLLVTINKTETDLQIEIRDTGIGIQDDILAKLNEMLANKGNSTDQFFNHHTGISNVCRRFFLAYGKDTSIRIQSNPGSGTIVNLSIPLAQHI